MRWRNARPVDRSPRRSLQRELTRGISRLPDAAVAQVDDTIGMRRDFGVVSDDDLRAGHFVEGCQQTFDRVRVEVDGRFVEDDEGGIAEQRPGDPDPLALPAGDQRALVADFVVVAAWQLGDKAIEPGASRGPVEVRCSTVSRP